MEEPILIYPKRIVAFQLIASLMLLFISTRTFAQCVPHSIFTAQNDPVLYACAGDGKADNFTFLKTDTSLLKYAFVLADIRDNIIQVQANPNFNFDGNVPTSFRVWGISYSDSISFVVGSDVSTISPVTGCARLSENVIMVVRDVPGKLNVFLNNGKSDTSICLNNNKLDTIFFKTEGTNNSKSIYVLSLFGGLILDTFSNNKYVLEGLAQQSYFVYSLSYVGNLNIIKNVSKLSDKSLASSCFTVGTIPVRINLDTLVQGTLQSLTAQTLFCPQDNKPDLITVRTIDGVSPSTAFILVDENSICRDIQLHTTFDLNNNPPGTYTIMALQFSGTLLLKIGDTVSRTGSVVLSTDCYVWAKDILEVILVIPVAGNIKTTIGDTILFGCPGDRLPDRFTFEVAGQSANAYILVVVNAQNKILSISTPGGFVDFEQFPTGTYTVFGVSYTGDLLKGINSDFAGAISNDCYAITANRLMVNLAIAKGGSIALGDGQNTYFTCPGVPGPRKISLNKTNASNSPYQYVLTTEGGNVLSFVVNDSLDFSNLQLTTMRIYGVAYSGKRIINQLNNLFVSSFSDGCSSISDNFILVVRDQPRGGGLRLPDGGNKELFCPSDTQSKILQVRNVDVSTHPYSLILTNDTMKILQITPGFTFNFQNQKEGLYRIYGVSYVGAIELNSGDVLDFTKFSNECFSFSSNFIEVVIGEIDGGTLTSSEGSTIAYVCPSNLDADLIRIIPQNAKSLSYRYVITDELNIITGFSSVDQIDFGTGVINTTCRVYGVAFKGDFIGAINKNVLQSVFSNYCYNLSENFVTIKKTVPPPHRILTRTKDTVYTICTGDSKADSIQFSTSDSLGFKTAFIVVDFNNKIFKVATSNTVDFNKDSVGLYRIYSVIYTGRLLVSTGLSLISGLAISDDCFSLSSNFIIADVLNQGPFCTITSIPETQWIKRFNVYPNPSDHQVTVRLQLYQSLSLPAQLTMMDLNGKEIWRSTVNLHTDNAFTIPVSGLANGMYMINIKSGNFTATRKLAIGR